MYGIMPANGLIYAPQHPCACYQEAKLSGFNALAPAAQQSKVTAVDDSSRLIKGPVFDAVQKLTLAKKATRAPGPDRTSGAPARSPGSRRLDPPGPGADVEPRDAGPRSRARDPGRPVRRAAGARVPWVGEVCARPTAVLCRGGGGEFQDTPFFFPHEPLPPGSGLPATPDPRQDLLSPSGRPRQLGLFRNPPRRPRDLHDDGRTNGQRVGRCRPGGPLSHPTRRPLRRDRSSNRPYRLLTEYIP